MTNGNWNFFRGVVWKKAVNMKTHTCLLLSNGDELSFCLILIKLLFYSLSFDEENEPENWLSNWLWVTIFTQKIIVSYNQLIWLFTSNDCLFTHETYFYWFSNIVIIGRLFIKLKNVTCHDKYKNPKRIVDFKFPVVQRKRTEKKFSF